MKKLTKIIAAAALVLGVGAGLSACVSDADTASQNISTAAEQFEVQRTITAINGITGDLIFYAEGRCSFEDRGNHAFDLTCKYGPNEYRKSTFFVGDQDSVVVAQEEPIDVSVYHTRIIIKPEAVLPDVDLEVGKQ